MNSARTATADGVKTTHLAFSLNKCFRLVAGILVFICCLSFLLLLDHIFFSRLLFSLWLLLTWGFRLLLSLGLLLSLWLLRGTFSLLLRSGCSISGYRPIRGCICMANLRLCNPL